MGLVGIIPAAGVAERIDGLPKYLLPVKEGYLLGVLCERMNEAGATDLLIGANPNNRNLLEHYAPANALVYTKFSKTMSETVLAAQPWCGKANVLFGMPDSWWSNQGGYRWLAEELSEELPCCVAVWKARESQRGKLGMVMTQAKWIEGWQRQIQEVIAVKDKPGPTNSFRDLWGAMAWHPRFWEFIRPEDPHVGYAIERAVGSGVTVRAVSMNGEYWDCGTRDSYFELIRSFR